MNPVIQQLQHDCDLTGLHRSDPASYPSLLQSTAQGRFDILFAFPGDSLLLNAAGQLQGPDNGPAEPGDFLEGLDLWWREHRTARFDSNGLPFTGGWFIYLGYELAAQIEPCLRLPANPTVLPVAVATRFRSAVIRDHRRNATWIVAEPGQQELARRIATDSAALSRRPAGALPDNPVVAVSEPEPSRYTRAVSRILDYIRDGDVFQVNLSRQWDVDYQEAVDPAGIYRQLCIHNPAPFSGLVRLGDSAIISSSPERLVAVRNGLVETRPIAGTRPRSLSGTKDRAYSSELLAHPKERAEHIMLIDLERNDLGRICVPGTIEVNELMALESYAHVHHIVSNIRGRMRTDVTPGQVIRAVFPGGTITGCPKVRCMEIIAELERTGRGAYTGSAGYLNRDGSMDLNILIRTMVAQAGRVSLRAGAGIVADSVPEAELAETRAKARGLLRALGLDRPCRK
ncbi:MAG TPA: aminodeoxychorismate synthase component I [Gammaproteobacteria bacterium]|nr:aminodeoxychorismate synthase component I [Gammaproteobacteria bacterium]